MKRTSRRSLFGLRSRTEPLPQESSSAKVESAESAAAAGDRESSQPGERTQFSLEEFYRARGPQKMPPIVIRPEVLLHSVPTTAVGVPPPHDPPAAKGQPLYEELRRETKRNS